MKTIIGITSTIPQEIPISNPEYQILDLNNIFITDSNPEKFINIAQTVFPRTYCAWIKALYGVMCLRSDIKTIIGIVEGDCSNTKVLLEILKRKNKAIIPFSYPYLRNYEDLKNEFHNFCKKFGTNLKKAEKIFKNLNKIRNLLDELDMLTFEKGIITSFENHLYLVQASDFCGNPDKFKKDLKNFLKIVRNRKPLKNFVRLGFIGVPPIFPQIYEFVEKHNARIIFNEVQRQFTLPGKRDDFVNSYLNFTYPYSLDLRIKDIIEQIKQREIEGIICYTQSFCYKNGYSSIIKEVIPVPVLIIEGQEDTQLDLRTMMRIENFITMLKCK